MSDGRIVDFAEYGRHIALRCKNHPHMRWSTKNICCIGARSIFYCGAFVGGEFKPHEPECTCSGELLEPCPEELGHPWDSQRPAKE